MSDLTGVLLIDKAKGPTSHDVVQAVRDATGQKRCGHTGTLDPLASGLLPMCVGRATRFARFLFGMVKTYRAVVRFGFSTDTYDASGRPVGRIVDGRVDRHELSACLAGFVGRQEQVPPAFAAKKVMGERMYRLARAGAAVVPRPVVVVVRRITLLDVELDRIELELEVESGTYIRSLAHDLGRRLGLGAHLEELRRTRIGPFSVEEAVSVDRIRELAEAGRIQDVVISPFEALSELPIVRLAADAASRVLHGRRIEAEENLEPSPAGPPERAVRLVGPGEAFLGVGVIEADGRLRPLVNLEKPAPLDTQRPVAPGFTG